MGSPWPQPAGILWVWEGPEDSFSFIPFERCSGTFRGLCQNRTSYFYSRLTVTVEQVRTLSGWSFEVWKELKGSLCFVPGPVKGCSKSYQSKRGQIIRKTNIYKLYYTRPFTNIITFILGDRYYSSILYIEKLNLQEIKCHRGKKCQDHAFKSRCDSKMVHNGTVQHGNPISHMALLTQFQIKYN